jgi:hypothetical protein
MTNSYSNKTLTPLFVITFLLSFTLASCNGEEQSIEPALSSSANIGLGTFGNSVPSSLNTVEGYLLHTAKQSLAFNNIFVLKIGLGLVIH